MSAGTLVVKIAANITDFTTGLDAAEKRLMKAGDKLASLGSDLSMRVTAPLVAMGALLAKSAAEDAASIDKMGRTFGKAQGDMEAFVQSLMKSVPETDDAMRGLLTSTDTLLVQLGLAPSKANAMTKSVATLAGDMAAFKHVSMEVAEDALEKALLGKTKGMAQFGIAVSEADIKAKAYQLGIAKTGAELTHAQTAQAALAAILERSSKIQGEAARTYDANYNAIARLKQAADGVADSFGAVVLPTFVAVANGAKSLAETLTDLPTSMKGLIVGGLAVVAGLGPMLYVAGNVVKVFTLMRAGMGFLTASSGALSGITSLVAGVRSLSEALTVAEIAGAGLVTALTPLLIVGGIAAVIGVIGYAFWKSGEQAREAAAKLEAYKVTLAGFSTAKQSQASAKSVAAQIAALQASPVTKTGDPFTDAAEATKREQQITDLTEQLQAANRRTMALSAPDVAGVKPPPGFGGDGKDTNPFKSLEERATMLGRIYELTNAKGHPLVGLNQQITDTMDALGAALGKQTDKWGEVALRIREAMDALDRFGDATFLPALTRVSTVLDQVTGKLKTITVTLLPGLTKLQLTGMLSNIERDVPDRPRAGLLDANGQMRSISRWDLPAGISGRTGTQMPNITAANLPGFPQLRDPIVKQVSLQEAMAASLETLPEAFAGQLGNYLGPVLAKLGGGGAGSQIGGGVGAAFGNALGGLLGGSKGAIGKALIDKLGPTIGAAVGSMVPVVGTLLGGAVGSLAGGLADKVFGGLFGGGGPSPAELAAQQLQKLADAAKAVQEAISGLPQGIKIEAYAFEASAAGSAPAGQPTDPSTLPWWKKGTSSSAAGSSGVTAHFSGPITVNGVSDVAGFVKQLTAHIEQTAALGGVTGLELAMGGG